jgi:putative heme iron utilization protein
LHGNTMSQDRHAQPAERAAEPLYDVNIPTPTHAERARTLVARIPTGTLCTLALEPAGYPYGSFVTVAFDEGDPIFLISALAEHTKNLERDPRASLMVAENGAGDPLANGRVTMMGRCTPVEGDDGRARAAFLTVHPNAAYYADFRDFAFWKLRVNAIRYIGGYGRMSWVTQDDWQAAEADPLAPHAAGAIAHMNADHAGATVLYCRAFSKATDVTSATMTGVDRYGFDMSAMTPEGPRPIRVAFARPVTTPDELRAALVAMAKDARSRLG